VANFAIRVNRSLAVCKCKLLFNAKVTAELNFLIYVASITDMQGNLNSIDGPQACVVKNTKCMCALSMRVNKKDRKNNVDLLMK
jgi:hypothetical protein